MATVQQPYDTPRHPCSHWIEAEQRRCGQTEAVRRYLPGDRCPAHTPAALAGRAEPPEATGPPWWIKDDGATVPATPISTSSLHDRRAVESGRRVSGTRRRVAHQGEAYDARSGAA